MVMVARVEVGGGEDGGDCQCGWRGEWQERFVESVNADDRRSNISAFLTSIINPQGSIYLILVFLFFEGEKKIHEHYHLDFKKQHRSTT